MRALLGIKALSKDVPTSSFIKQLSLAFYLACSWTWCIGMFLPVILQNDFGSGAWLFFILFNIVGATSFVFIVKNKNNSDIFIHKHKNACIGFSFITIIFQLLFMGWTFSFLSPIESAIFFSLMASLFFIIYFISIDIAAIAVWILSAATFLGYINLQSDFSLANKIIDQVLYIDHRVAYVAPLLLLGFSLSPYLDLTFHRVVQCDQHNNHQGMRLSFLVGFPLLFAFLMIFSLAYVDTAKQMLISDSLFKDKETITLLFFYFILQTSFTIIAHVKELSKVTTKEPIRKMLGAGVLAFVLSVALSPAMNETLYRCVMSFYGVVAPAYVWLVAFNKHPTPLKVVLFTIAVALALCAVPTFYPNQGHAYFYLLATMVVVIMKIATRMLSKLSLDQLSN